MAVFEVETWLVAEGKDAEHAIELRRWLQWVKDHRDLFPEWKSVRYLEKTVAGDDTGRHMIIWEYDSMAAFEGYKARRKDYEGPYKEYKENDPYHKGVFIHHLMTVEFWKDQERDLWIE
jgi:hypothetical protein